MSGSARIIVITGNGKGKTTAAMGMALRASGHGMRAVVIQFIKNCDTGEMAAFKKIGIEFVQAGLGFLPRTDSKDFAKHKAAAHKGLELAAELMASNNDMIILDEICLAVSKGLLAEGDVVDCLGKAGDGQCVVLTGRGATEKIINFADTVSELVCVKHGLSSGIAAQKGVEF
ncbi:MAG: cob(I)yrinic acid a,c-diamide adenosyltransferase [Phycisphaerae bacterium]|nr:cob(I)yrinic acid a,c-diamide adenosyltransferase [Phycisphaerae bacterium]